MGLGLAILTQLNNYRSLSQPFKIRLISLEGSIVLGATSLGVVVVYPLMKRITYWPQFVLGLSLLILVLCRTSHMEVIGLAFNWGALLGSSAILGYCDWAVALPLYLGSICWTIVYDTIYAHQDKLDDLKASVKSTALLFGDRSRTVLTVFSGAFVTSLASVGYLNGQSLPFYLVSVGGATLHLWWQLKTVNFDDRPNCWQRFCSNRDLGFFGVVRDSFRLWVQTTNRIAAALPLLVIIVICFT